MARVFLSYATADLEAAVRVYEWLDGDGHSVFFDRSPRDGIGIGEDWKPRLYREVLHTDAVVCVMTRAYVESTWCTAEVAIADSRGCLLIPLIAEPGVTHPLIDRQQYALVDGDLAAARNWLLATLRRLDAGGRGGWRGGRNPYPGLEPFTAELSTLFFGRARETRELAARLRVQPGRGVLAVAGPSGCGKSSLLLAGLLPTIADDPAWLALDVWSPGDDPVYALALSITSAAGTLGLDWTPDRVRERLGAEGDLRRVAAELLARSKGQPGRRLLVPIDQTEQMFSPACPPARRAELGAVLGGAIGSMGAGGGRVRVVATLRSEYLADLGELPWLPASAIDTYLLGPLATDMLRLAIEEPARIAGLRLEPELVARLAADTGTGDALPLLGYALNQLAENRGPGDRITVAGYEGLGATAGERRLSGLHAVLVKQADEALKVAGERSGLTERRILAGLVRLVTVDATGRSVGRPVARASLTEPMRAVADVFADHRLITADGSGRHVRFAHEALLSAWPPLAAASAEHGQALRTARSVEQAAHEWVVAGRADGYLWADERLTVSEIHLRPAVVNLDPVAKAFLKATRARIEAKWRRERRRRVRTITVLSVLLVLALGAAGVAALQANAAARQRDATMVHGLLTQADAVRTADPRLALRLGLAAHDIGAGPHTRAGLLDTLTMNNYASTLRGHTSSVFTAAFSRDGRILATGDGDDHALRLWNVEDPARPVSLGEPLTDHHDQVMSASFHKDGRTLATASPSELILWDVTDPRHPRVRAKRPSAGKWYPNGLTVAFSPDGTTLASTNGDRSPLWDVSDPDNPVQRGLPLLDQDTHLSDVAFSSDGTLLAGSTVTGDLRVWDMSDPRSPAKRAEINLDDNVTAIGFVPDGRTLVVATIDHMPDNLAALYAFDVTDPSDPQQLDEPRPVHAGILHEIAFADGGRLATASDDGTVTMWNFQDGRLVQTGGPLTDHTDDVNTVAFSPTGHAMATGSADHTVILWGRENPVQPVWIGQLSGHSGDVSDTVFDHRQRTLITADEDGIGAVWDVADPAAPRGPVPLVGHHSPITALAASPAAPVVATGTDAGVIRLWDVTDPAHPARLGDPVPGHVGAVVKLQFSSDGQTLHSADGNAVPAQWDVTGPATPRKIAEAFIDQRDSTSEIEFSPDGRTMISSDGAIYDLTNFDHVRLFDQRLAEGSSIAYSPDSKVVAAARLDGVALWDVSVPYRPRRLGEPVPTGDVTEVMISPDGRILAVIGPETGLSMWSITDPSHPHPIGEPITEDKNNFVTALGFAPDSRLLATGWHDGTVRLWDLSLWHELDADLVARACARAGRGLDARGWQNYVGADYEYRSTCPS